MTVICYAASSFCRDGKIFTIPANQLGLIIDAPEWIKDTFLFNLLAKDGSIKFVEKADQKRLENDPMDGINAEGKEIPVEEDKAPKEAVEAPKKRTRKKKDDAE